MENIHAYTVRQPLAQNKKIKKPGGGYMRSAQFGMKEKITVGAINVVNQVK